MKKVRCVKTVAICGATWRIDTGGAAWTAANMIRRR
jgi:hypothetical protein